MKRATTGRRTAQRAGVAMATLALSLGSARPALGQEGSGEESAPGREVVGAIVVPAAQGLVGARTLAWAGRVLDWCGPADGSGWDSLVGGLGEAGQGAADRGWSLVLGDDLGLGLAPREAATMPTAQTVAFDIALECNTLRSRSAQPFSRSARGRVLDSLGIDNARRARLTGIFGDPDDLSVMSVVLFTESRAEAPGRWRALRVGTVAMAASRGEPAPGRPVEVDFGELWTGLLFAAADGVLALDPACEGLSTEERLGAWGMQRVVSVRALASGLEGRVWVWSGVGEGGVVCALPLSRGSTDRRVADGLRGVFGQRLSWDRDDAGRATGTLALVRENRAAREGDRTVVVRFIKIAERTTLTVATSAADLDSAVETLADIPQ